MIFTNSHQDLFDVFKFQKTCQNLQSSQIADFKWISQTQKPQIYTRNGASTIQAWQSPKGFTVGLNVNGLFSVSELRFGCQTNYHGTATPQITIQPG